MSITDEQLGSLRQINAGAVIQNEGEREYVFLPNLKITVGPNEKTLDGLLCPSEKDGYKTRLFFSETIVERPTIGDKAANWTAHVILGRTWHSWSWQGVEPSLPLVQMLLAHLRALR